MTKHPLDHDRKLSDDQRALNFTKIDRETGPAGEHAAAKAAFKRPRDEGRSGDLARIKRAGLASD
ncbi:MAG: hypothetical protein ABI459_08105 [Deltaproteobacteria bacterium]